MNIGQVISNAAASTIDIAVARVVINLSLFMRNIINHGKRLICL